MENKKNYNIEIRKPRTHRGKKYLQSKQSHVIEQEKKTLFVKGKKTSEAVTGLMQEFVFYSI